jgi:hypothetical protein
LKKFFNTAGPCDPEIHYMLGVVLYEMLTGARDRLESVEA